MPGLDPYMRALSTVHATPAFPSVSPDAKSANAAGTGENGFDTALHGIFEIVNPLQHLPVVGTLYRAISGDKIGTFEKIAGDALYGGLWGAVSSVADAAFEAVTGKDFGSTVLALFTGAGDDKAATGMAANTPVQPQQVEAQAQPALQPVSLDVTALSDALTARGMNTDISARALYAYRQMQTLTPMLVAAN